MSFSVRGVTPLDIFSALTRKDPAALGSQQKEGLKLQSAFGELGRRKVIDDNPTYFHRFA